VRYARIQAIIIFALVVALGVQWWAGHEVDGLDYPQQKVISRLPGLAYAGTTYDRPLEVTGRKCVIGDEPVSVTGILSWSALEPVVSVVEVSRGANVLQPGTCPERRYVNDIPAPVIKRNEELLTAVGGICIQWKITGIETPTNRRIKPETWSTEPFWLCSEPPKAVAG
jgi:hypothetical protein